MNATFAVAFIKSCFLEVRKLSISSDPPQDIVLEPVYGCLNNTVVLSCDFDAYPKAQLVWEKMETLVVNQSEVLVMATNDTSLNSTPKFLDYEALAPDFSNSYDVVKAGTALELHVS